MHDANDPLGLEKQFYFVTAPVLAFRGGVPDGLEVQHFQEETDQYGKFTGRIEWSKRVDHYNIYFSGRIEFNMVHDKNHQGGGQALSDTRHLIPDTECPDLCPVRIWRKLMSMREGVTSRRFFLYAN